jgi:hypothetical protein
MYTQAQIEIEKKAVFAELKAAVENALVAHADDFLQVVKRSGLRVRQFEELLERRAFEQLPGTGTSRSCEELYHDMGQSDQGLLRELYLTRIEEIPVALREKYLKLFRYQ